jgi:hypothetical protein
MVSYISLKLHVIKKHILQGMLVAKSLFSLDLRNS